MKFEILALLAALACVPMPCAAGERAIDHVVTVRATPQALWSAWTTREGIRSFFAPEAEIDARPGGAFHIHFNPAAPAGLRGADDSRYLALQAPRMLSFDWNAPPSLPEARAQRTMVIVRFTPLDAEHTQVSLHQVGWGDGGQWDQAFAYFDRAWASVLRSLVQSFERGTR